MKPCFGGFLIRVAETFTRRKACPPLRLEPMIGSYTARRNNEYYHDKNKQANKDCSAIDPAMN
jgi:hypothetical protein